MDVRDKALMEEIKVNLYKHGTLSILFYKMGGEWIVHKWGKYENVSVTQKDLFNKYKSAGFDDEADSLTLMELPQDANVIYRILSGLSLKNELNKLGYELE